MKTRCPSCQTTFRFTAEQFKARAGKVRCGQCQLVFDVIDNLQEEGDSPASLASAPKEPVVEAEMWQAMSIAPHVDSGHSEPVEPVTVEATQEKIFAEETEPLTEAEAQELGKYTGLILPRETTEIPGYSKWAEAVINAPFSLPEEKVTRWPFVFVALLLVLVLVGQIAFRFRSEIAVAVPRLRPALQLLSQAFKTNLPLPRHVELVSIETTDLQADAARGNLLVLNATLRNRAVYEQAYPLLELSLTDTADAAIARRVLLPVEYLSEKIPANQAFKAKSDVSVRLWIEAKDISAAGYRLYVFYP